MAGKRADRAKGADMKATTLPEDAATQRDIETKLKSSRYKSYFLFIFVTMTGFAYMDRVLMNTLGQAIKVDLDLSDTQLGMLGGLSIAVFYALFALPSARLAERYKRTYIVAGAVV